MITIDDFVAFAQQIQTVKLTANKFEQWFIQAAQERDQLKVRVQQLENERDTALARVQCLTSTT
jgi:phage tail tape-measure protein